MTTERARAIGLAILLAAGGCARDAIPASDGHHVVARDGRWVVDVAAWAGESGVAIDDGLSHRLVLEALDEAGTPRDRLEIVSEYDLFSSSRHVRIDDDEVALDAVPWSIVPHTSRVTLTIDPLGSEDVERMRHWLAHTTDVPAVFGTYASLLLHRRLGEPRWQSAIVPGADSAE